MRAVIYMRLSTPKSVNAMMLSSPSPWTKRVPSSERNLGLAHVRDGTLRFDEALKQLEECRKMQSS